MPTTIFLNGFENRVFAAGGATDGFWNTITGTAAVTEGTIFRGAGSRSMKCAMPAAAYQSLQSTTIAAQTRLASRFYFRKSGNPSANVKIFEIPFGGSVFCNPELSTTGNLFLNITGGTTPVDGSNIALNDNQWYLIDVVVDSNTTAYVCRLWVDGVVATTDGTTTGVGAGSITNPRIGVPTSATLSVARDLYFDDYIVGTASDINDKYGATDGIVALLPTADGTHSPSPPTAGRFKDAAGTDISGSNAAWDNLDAGDLTQTAERVSQPVIAGTEYLEVEFGTYTLPGSAPVAVQAEAGLNSDGTNTFSASTRAVIGGAETVIYTGDWSTGPSSKWYKRVLVSVANQGELDGLEMRFGYGSAQPAIPYWEGLMFEVDVGRTPPVAPVKNLHMYSDAVRRSSRW